MDEPKPTSPPSELNLALIIGASVGGVVVLLLVIFIIYRCKRKKEHGQQKQLVANSTTKPNQKQGQSNAGYEEVDEITKAPKCVNKENGETCHASYLQMKGVEPIANGNVITVEINAEYNNNAGSENINTNGGIANAHAPANGVVMNATASPDKKIHVENGSVPSENQKEEIDEASCKEESADGPLSDPESESSSPGKDENQSSENNDDSEKTNNDSEKTNDDNERTINDGSEMTRQKSLGEERASTVPSATDASSPDVPEEDVKDEDGDTEDDSKQDNDCPPQPESAELDDTVPHGAASLLVEVEEQDAGDDIDCSRFNTRDKNYVKKQDEDTGEVTCVAASSDEEDDTHSSADGGSDRNGELQDMKKEETSDDGVSPDDVELSVQSNEGISGEWGSSQDAGESSDDKLAEASVQDNEDSSGKQESSQDAGVSTDDKLPKTNEPKILNESLISEKENEDDKSAMIKPSSDITVPREEQEEINELRDDKESSQIFSASGDSNRENPKPVIERELDQKSGVDVESESSIDTISGGQDSQPVQKSETSDSSSPKVERNDLQKAASNDNVVNSKRPMSPQKDNNKTRNALKGTDSTQENKKSDRMSQTIATLERMHQQQLAAIQYASKPKPKPPVEVNKTPAQPPADIARYSPPKRRVNTDQWPPQRASLNPNEGTARFSMEEELQRRLKSPSGVGLKSGGGVNRHKGPVMRKSYGGSTN